MNNPTKNIITATTKEANTLSHPLVKYDEAIQARAK